MKNLPSSMYLRAGEPIYMHNLVVYTGPVDSDLVATPSSNPAPVGTVMSTPLGGEFIGVDLGHDSSSFEVHILSVPSEKVMQVTKKIRKHTDLPLSDAMSIARNATAGSIMMEEGFALVGNCTRYEAAKIAYELACAGAEVNVMSSPSMMSAGEALKSNISDWKNIARDERIRMIRL